jgi:hypothetical protein
METNATSGLKFGRHEVLQTYWEHHKSTPVPFVAQNIRFKWRKTLYQYPERFTVPARWLPEPNSYAFLGVSLQETTILLSHLPSLPHNDSNENATRCDHVPTNTKSPLDIVLQDRPTDPEQQAAQQDHHDDDAQDHVDIPCLFEV